VALRRPNEIVLRLLEVTGALPLFDIETLSSLYQPDPQQLIVWEQSLRTAISDCGVDMGTAQLFDRDIGALRIVAHQGFSHEFVEYFDIVAGGETSCGAAMLSAKPAWVSDVAQSPIFAGTPGLDVLTNAGVRAVASVPLIAHDGGLIGVLNAHRPRSHKWTASEKCQFTHLCEITSHRLRETATG
jgi:GAF domain-containing protein